MKSGPLLLLVFFGLLIGAVIVVTQSIATAVQSAASAYSAVGTTTAEQEGQTERTSVITTFLSSLFSGASAALV